MCIAQGVYCAMITPIKDGKVDMDITSGIIDRIMSAGFSGILVAGSTGEGPLLTKEQYRDISSYVIEKGKKKLQVILGASGNSFPSTLEHLEMAAILGADAALIISPYYFKSGDVDLVRYYSSLAECSPVPIVMYNLPRISGQKFTLNEVKTLAQQKKIIGYKDSSGDLAGLQQIAAECSSRTFSIFQGLATLSYASWCIGVHGIFSATSNLVPELDTAIYDAYKKSNEETCRLLQKLQIDLAKALVEPGWPVGIGVKNAMALIGQGETETCYPIQKAVSIDVDKLRNAMEAIRGALTEQEVKSSG